MKITWYGNASFGIKAGGDSILIDPFIELPGGEHPNRAEDFLGYRNILLTHGHVDHLGNLPEILAVSDQARELARAEEGVEGGTGHASTMEGSGKARVFCTKTPRKTLLKKHVTARRIREIRAGDRLHFHGMTVDVLQGKHIRFDRELVLHTLFSARVLKDPGNVAWFLKEHLQDHEAGETVAYLIRAEGRSVLLMGSLGIAPGMETELRRLLGEGPDLLILPYQGATDLVTPALEVVDKIRPGKVVMSHFDDAFPPVSQSIDVSGFVEQMALRNPEVEVIVPEAGREMRIF